MAKKKQEAKLKEPVRIRFKQLANGNQSIYLDYYTGDVIRKENYVGGKRQYEFLKLYLIPDGKSSVSCPLKPSDSAPLKHSTMPP